MRTCFVRARRRSQRDSAGKLGDENVDIFRVAWDLEDCLVVLQACGKAGVYPCRQASLNRGSSFHIC